jgi:hypothetical protein
MNVHELADWLKNSEFVDCDAEVDGCGNRLETRIYLKDGKYYRLEYCNGYPCEKWGEKGYIHGEYEPIEVFKKEVEVIETFYFTKEEME